MRRRRTIETRDDDAVAITTGYILNIGVATLVIGVLVLSLQGTVDNVQDITHREQMEMTTEHVATRMAEADTIVQTGNNVNGTLIMDLDTGLGSRSFRITIRDDEILMSAGTANVSTTYNVTAEVVNTTLEGGGTRRIVYNSTHLEVR